MTQVGIAQLKAHLSEWLRRVRRGERLVVLDRSTPVATIEPLSGPDSLRVEAPADPSAPAFRSLRFRKLRRDVDPDDALATVREDRI